MRVAKRPLNHAAVVKANAAVGGPVKTPADASKWMDAYVKAGGEVEQAKQPQKVQSAAHSCKASTPAVCKQLAAEIAKMDDVADRAALSSNVYDIYSKPPKTNIKPLPPGYSQLNDAQVAKLLNVTPKEAKDLTHPDNSSYRAAIYSGPNGKTFLAFRGTETGSGKMVAAQEIYTDLNQAFSSKPDSQYKKGVALAGQLEDSVGKDNLEIVGHSKGGGMAAAAGAVTGAKTTTFNAAGVNPNTVPGTDLPTASTNTESYVVKGEVLNWSQDHPDQVRATLNAKIDEKTASTKASTPDFLKPAVDGLGEKAKSEVNKIPDPPKSVGKRTELPSDWNDSKPVEDRIPLHLMDSVDKGIAKKKADLEKQFKQRGCTH